MNGLVINKQKEYPRKQSSAASEHSKYQELKWQQHRLTSFSLYAYISVNSLTLFITHTWKDICCWTFTFSNASLVLKELHFIQYAHSGTSLLFLFYSSCISNFILTAMPPPQLLKISGFTVIFFFRECVCMVVILSVKWQELDSNYFHDWWVSFQSTLYRYNDLVIFFLLQKYSKKQQFSFF